MKKYTDQQIIDCYLSFHSSTKAGEELGIAAWSVCRVAHKHGVQLDGRKYHSGCHNSGGKKGIRSAKHGTRTMYERYGCRCDECCKAEYQHYLKRTETKVKKRYNSKLSGGEYNPALSKSESQRRSDANRYKAYTSNGKSYKDRIKWYDIANQFGMTCAICGCEVDPTDTWENENGCICYGRKYPTVDHIIPLKYGGADTLDNVQLTCKHCNSAKGTKT